MAQYARHVNPAFVKLLGIFGYGRVFARAKDVWIWDTEGRRYLDLLAGYGAVNLGHNHPRLLERLTRFLGEDTLGFCHIGPPAPAAALAAALAERAGEALSACVFSTGGGEAVEAGLKLARLATGRPGFLYCEGGFHGTSLGTLSIMGHERMRAPLEPLLADCAALPFGDLGALESALRPKRTAAFVVEPILGGATSIHPYEPGTWGPPDARMAESPRGGWHEPESGGTTAVDERYGCAKGTATSDAVAGDVDSASGGDAAVIDAAPDSKENRPDSSALAR